MAAMWKNDFMLGQDLMAVASRSVEGQIGSMKSLFARRSGRSAGNANLLMSLPDVVFRLFREVS